MPGILGYRLRIIGTTDGLYFDDVWSAFRAVRDGLKVRTSIPTSLDAANRLLRPIMLEIVEVKAFDSSCACCGESAGTHRYCDACHEDFNRDWWQRERQESS